MHKSILRSFGVFALFTLFLSPLAAQGFEVNPYVGFFWTHDKLSSIREFKDEHVVGLRAGGYLTDRVMLEGNFGYINHLEFDGTDPQSRGMMFEGTVNYHFFTDNLQPYVGGGVGALTTQLDDDNTVPVPYDDGDAFFALNYGGGVKAIRLWGPMGVRGDVRFHTLPNFLGESTTWFEVTGGLTFTFGE